MSKIIAKHDLYLSRYSDISQAKIVSRGEEVQSYFDIYVNKYPDHFTTVPDKNWRVIEFIRDKRRYGRPSKNWPSSYWTKLDEVTFLNNFVEGVDITAIERLSDGKSFYVDQRLIWAEDGNSVSYTLDQIRISSSGELLFICEGLYRRFDALCDLGLAELTNDNKNKKEMGANTEKTPRQKNYADGIDDAMSLLDKSKSSINGSTFSVLMQTLLQLKVSYWQDIATSENKK